MPLVGAMEVRTLRRPLSRWVFQLRADCKWRELSPQQHEDELAGPAEPAVG